MPNDIEEMSNNLTEPKIDKKNLCSVIGYHKVGSAILLETTLEFVSECENCGERFVPNSLIQSEREKAVREFAEWLDEDFESASENYYPVGTLSGLVDEFIKSSQEGKHDTSN